MGYGIALVVFNDDLAFALGDDVLYVAVKPGEYADLSRPPDLEELFDPRKTLRDVLG